MREPLGYLQMKLLRCDVSFVCLSGRCVRYFHSDVVRSLIEIVRVQTILSFITLEIFSHYYSLPLCLHYSIYFSQYMYYYHLLFLLVLLLHCSMCYSLCLITFCLLSSFLLSFLLFLFIFFASHFVSHGPCNFHFL